MTAGSAETPDELLTTGEAAKLIGSSRQHVVDLCLRGILPYTSVGTHRRIQRQDLEALRSRTEGSTARIVAACGSPTRRQARS